MPQSSNEDPSWLEMTSAVFNIYVALFECEKHVDYLDISLTSNPIRGVLQGIFLQ